MSQHLVNQYLNDLDRYKKISGSLSEGVISEAFKGLLKAWSRQSNLTFINQYEFVSNQKTRIRPDGTILHDLRVPLGYWEAKDSGDDLDAEIAKKLAKGYPQDNIIFEDSREAVLIQNRGEVTRCDMTDTAKLLKLLTLFFSYERQEIAEFRKAVQQFKADLPAVLEALRDRGQPMRRFERKPGMRAEDLDCVIYPLAHVEFGSPRSGVVHNKDACATLADRDQIKVVRTLNTFTRERRYHE